MMRILSSRLASNFLSSYKLCSKAGNTLKIGDILQQRRIYKIEDVVEYSKVSHDTNPLHFDTECAQAAGFQNRLVHGILVASLFPRIISLHFTHHCEAVPNFFEQFGGYLRSSVIHRGSEEPGAVYVSQNLHFRQPVYVGDEIIGEVQAVNIREFKKNSLVKFSTRCLKKASDLVIDGEATAILSSLILQEQDRE